MTENGISWRKYPKSRQKEFLTALKEKENIKGVKQEAVVQAQWYQVLNYCFADYRKNHSQSKSNRLSRSISTFYEGNDVTNNEDGRYATHMEKLLDTDGLMFVNNITVALNLLAEFKDDVKMDKRLEQERILGQVIIYLKHIQQHIKAGNKLHLEMPNVVLAADVNQAFVINARVLYPYLDLDIDWDKYTPRGFYDNLEPVEILHKLDTDQNINPYVYDTKSKDFDINDIIGLAADLASTSLDKNLRKIPVNQANIRGVYDEFLRLVTQDKTKVASDQELVSMFIKALTDHDSFVLKNNTAILIHDDNTITKYRVNGRNWYAFFSRFDTNYTAEQVKNISAIGDVLLKETARRFSGEYWTPTIWTNRAISEITKDLGADWKEKYYVWDCAAGSKNLTRDYKFKHLFSSTLFEEELSLGQMYNVENVAFQYDFLNDDVDLSPDNILTSKLAKAAPDLAQALLKNKPIIFYTNPPYGTAGDVRMDAEHKKAGVADNKLHEIMKKDKIGAASQNLYTQFFYRIVLLKKAFKLTNVHIAYFSNSQYLNGGKYWSKFIKSLLSEFKFDSGFLFNAGEFSDTASNWGILFAVLSGVPTRDKIPTSFNVDVEADKPGEGILSLTRHKIRNLPNDQLLSSWVRNAFPDRKSVQYCDPGTYPTFSSAFRIKETSKHKPPKYPVNALGYAWNKGSNVEKAKTETALFSACYRDGNGFPIISDNFERVIINFAIRKATKHSWLINKDNYSQPTFDSKESYRKVLADSLVYSLFNHYSYQVSLKDVQYLNNNYNVKNEFFWLSKSDIKALADKYKYARMGLNIEDDNERFVYKKLQDLTTYLSPEAQRVLYYAKRVVDETFGLRKILNEDYPEFSFMSWDAGWEQIRRLMSHGQKPDSYKNGFLPCYEELEKKINGYIYQYGFLE